MASPVDTSVKHFLSTMVGAPVLNGVAGSMIAVLDAYLVTGFDIKAATTLVVAAGVATLSFSGSHSATVDSVILVSGVGGGLMALNGEQKVTAIAAGQIKFATAAADGTAAGSIAFKMAPAGWEKPFFGTNLAVYRSQDVLGTRMYVRVDDTGTTACRVVGYETMIDANTGSAPFPAAAQISGGGSWPKSGSTDATARPWVLVADGRKFYLHVCPTGLGGATFGFGDDLAARPGGDPYACSLSVSFQYFLANMNQGAFDTPAVQSVALPRNYTGLGSSSLHAAYPFTGNAGYLSGADGTLGAFPSEVDGSLRLAPRFLAIPGKAPRSNLPGLYHVPQAEAFSTFKRGDIIPGTGALTGRKLMAVNTTTALTASPTTANTGVSFIDITGPWR